MSVLHHSTRFMVYSIIILFEWYNPACQFTVRILDGLQPLQRLVICEYDYFLRLHIRMKVLRCPNNSIRFLFSSSPVFFRTWKCFRSIWNHSFCSTIILRSWPETTNTTAENMRTKVPIRELQDGEIYKNDIEL